VDIADFTTLVDFILDPMISPFNTMAADVDGSGSINVADVTALVDLVLAK
jgi:hypothetical protein